MLDPTEREIWFNEFYRAGTKFADKIGDDPRIKAWAKSMSLIAEQFTDNDDGETVDPQPVE